MRAVHHGAIIAVGVWMAACAHVSALRQEPPSTLASARYVTFFVLQGQSSGTASIDRQANADVSMALTDKGLVATSPEEAEAVVVVHTATPAKHSRDALYQGWGGWNWRSVDTHAPNAIDDYRVGSLIADVFDAGTKQLLWSGWVSDRVARSSNRQAQGTNRAAARLFKDLPFEGLPVGSPEFSDAQSITAPGRRMQIIFSPSPAVLVTVDGEPAYEPIIGTELERLTNTTALVVRTDAGIHYLKLGDVWMEADDLFGFWSEAGALPDGAETAAAKARRDGRTDLFESARRGGMVPAVCVSTEPAALVVTDGPPRYVLYKGTSLLRLSNTTSIVFREPTDQELYVRLPAGWFRAWSTTGPWEQVANDRLPSDLRNEEPRTKN